MRRRHLSLPTALGRLLTFAPNSRAGADPDHGGCEDSRQAPRKPSASPVFIGEDVSGCAQWYLSQHAVGKRISGEGDLTGIFMDGRLQAPGPELSPEMLLHGVTLVRREGDQHRGCSQGPGRRLRQGQSAAVSKHPAPHGTPTLAWALSHLCLWRGEACTAPHSACFPNKLSHCLPHGSPRGLVRIR